MKQGTILPLSWYVEKAIQLIKENEPADGYSLAFSGGKDSIVLAELAKIANVKHLTFYSATGIDPPEVVKFIRQNYPHTFFVRPKMSFYKYVKHYMPPTRAKRWC